MKKINRPGYELWIRGSSRGTMEGVNRDNGFPCYCGSIWSGICDFCTEAAPRGGERWETQLAEQKKPQTCVFCNVTAPDVHSRGGSDPLCYLCHSYEMKAQGL